MRLEINLVLVLIFMTTNLLGQKNKYPENFAQHCEILKNKKGENVVRSSKLPIDFVGAANPADFKVVAACKEGKKINIMIEFLGKENYSGKGNLLVYTAIKDKGKWVQKVAMDMIISGKVSLKDKKLIECFFPDMNTLFLGYEFFDGEKEAYLVRFTNEGFKFYNPKANPYKQALRYKDEKRMQA